MIVGMNGPLASERRACKLATPVRNHLIHVHVELGAAAGHPDVQREHIVMLAREDLVARLNNEPVPLGVEVAYRMVGMGCGFLQSRISRNHLAWHEILPYAEVFNRPLRLSSPQPGVRYIHFTEA